VAANCSAHTNRQLERRCSMQTYRRPVSRTRHVLRGCKLLLSPRLAENRRLSWPEHSQLARGYLHGPGALNARPLSCKSDSVSVNDCTSLTQQSRQSVCRPSVYDAVALLGKISAPIGLAHELGQFDFGKNQRGSNLILLIKWKGYENLAFFDQCLALFRKRYKIRS